MKRALDRIEGRDEQLQIRAGDFNISDAIMDRPIIQKINKEIENWNNTINQLDLTNQPQENTHSSKVHMEIYRIDHILGNKALRNLTRLQSYR